MDLLFLNEEFEIYNVVDTYKSFSWTRRYFDVGCFNIEISYETYKLLKEANAKYLYCKDFKEIAKIEGMKYSYSKQNQIVVLSGRFLECLLEDRVIPTTRVYSGTTEEIARSIVNDFCINCANPIPKLRLGEYKGLGSEKIYRKTGSDVKTALYELLKLDGLSFNINYDYENNELVFEVWSGLDRTESQVIKSWAVFSKNFENILTDNYFTNDSKYKNYVYVAGQGRAENRVVVEIDKIKQDDERRELYVDARDLQQDEDMTLEEYEQLLVQRGLEKLQEYNKVEVAEFEIDLNSNLKYKEDYDLGDLATYKNEDFGNYIDNRIVEISEIFDGQNKSIEIVFGDDYIIKKVVS